jgi:hypothetical protein
VDAVVGDINGDSPVGLSPVPIHRDQCPDQSGGKVGQWKGENRQREAGGPGKALSAATGHRPLMMLSFKKEKRPMLSVF